ncbi:MAG: MgtC/SapB family protein [Clostridiales bacterium]|jgi:putative Mg2+ transporter-C (MgtC) family protein|nr:MgtC/SapB family protein [Clostridiales bacterium]
MLDSINNIDLYEINMLSVFLRLILAVILGGIIGLERGANKHQAGLRTHILVCVGATLAMLTNQYIYETITISADPGRLGAQVISGIGFLGAGLILVTSRNKVKGLTTAAGLWASACTGLALGIGFYSGAIAAGILVFIVLAILPKLEVYFYNRSRVMNLYVELDSMNSLKEFLNTVRNTSCRILETNISKSDSVDKGGYSLYLSIRISKKTTHDEAIQYLSAGKGVYLVEELE